MAGEPTASEEPGDDIRILFRAQATSRLVDLAARRMQAAGRGYYTISSAGHESNAAIAAALRPTDPALLHYRSGAFYIRRAWQVPGIDPVSDILTGVAAGAAEPIAGGRHKVIGRAELAVIPQTSTIASHLPRAIGVAFAIERARKLGVASRWPADAVAVASFGDASANHSTAAGAINAALWCRHAGLPMPLLLVCEDNGLGISVRTPAGWIESAYGHREHLAYFPADGADPDAVMQAAAAAAEHVRTRRSPALIHLRTIRLYGHAGSDVEAAYRSPAEIADDEAHDPILATAAAIVTRGHATADEIVAEFRDLARSVAAAADKAMTAVPLRTRAEVMAPLIGTTPSGPPPATTPLPATSPDSVPLHGSPLHSLPDTEPPLLTVAQAINRTLADEMAARPTMLIFGEDVARKGGVYGVTRGLQHTFGAGRVFDTPLDEQTILGLALGAGISGLLPVPEIQYLAYLHNAEDQIRGEAATLPFFSNGHYRNPMVVRIAAYAYQKGFGGHFHNDNSIAVLRDIPGLVIASPALPDDAATLLRACLHAADTTGAVCAFLEPIALYHTKDRLADGDNGWLAPYPDTATAAPIGTGRTHGDGGDLTIITFGNGVRLSMRAAAALADAGIGARILDLRYLAPLPEADMLREAAATGRVLIVDETRHTGGVGEAIITTLVEHGFAGSIRRVAAADSFIPLGPAADLVLVTEDEITHAARELVGA